MMSNEGTMADGTHGSSLADRHGKSHLTWMFAGPSFQKLTASTSEPDNNCDDDQLVPVEPNKHIKQPTSGLTLNLFSHLPWELRRLVWEFALPRNVYWSARVDSKTRVPYPTIAFVCREALLVMKELGSMVTAWDRSFLQFVGLVHLPATIDPSIFMQTWFSPKLDVIVLDPEDLIMLDVLGEAARCDLLDICRSPTTPLVVPEEGFRYESQRFHQMYERYLKTRDTVFLNIGEHGLISKYETWNTIMAPRTLGEIGTMDLIRLDDTAAIVKYLEIWEHYCRVDTMNLVTTDYCNFGTWIEMAMDEEKGADTLGYMKTYKAWMVEDGGYVEHSVTPKARFLLGFADCIMSGHGSRRNRHRGHEIMDYTGKLKEGHPLVRELDIKLPDVIPVCTIQLLGPWGC